MDDWKNNWEKFKNEQPFKNFPFSKRNWGNELHSLCSFYGKLRPSIAHHLIKTFTNEGSKVFDCFCGSGTIPFEAGLLNRQNLGIDINPISIVLSKAKVTKQTHEGCLTVLTNLKEYIKNSEVENDTINKLKSLVLIRL